MTDIYIAVSHKMSNIMGRLLSKAIGSTSENTLLKPGNAIGHSIDLVLQRQRSDSWHWRSDLDNIRIWPGSNYYDRGR
jgi:hypothetical protein